jgi:Zn-dependent peptidase ImmA (M78 family)
MCSTPIPAGKFFNMAAAYFLISRDELHRRSEITETVKSYLQIVKSLSAPETALYPSSLTLVSVSRTSISGIQEAPL